MIKGSCGTRNWNLGRHRQALNTTITTLASLWERDEEPPNQCWGGPGDLAYKNSAKQTAQSNAQAWVGRGHQGHVVTGIKLGGLIYICQVPALLSHSPALSFLAFSNISWDDWNDSESNSKKQSGKRQIQSYIWGVTERKHLEYRRGTCFDDCETLGEPQSQLKLISPRGQTLIFSRSSTCLALF